MNSDSLIQLAQKSLRVTLGATASLIETLQDPQRREESLIRLQTEFSQLAEEWEVKGTVTEQEARTFVDNILSQTTHQANSTHSPSSSTSATSPTSTATRTATSPEVQQDLQELTAQLAAIRSELERLREPGS